MKRKKDDLLRLAFGELSAEAAQAVEAQAAEDPSARMELNALRDLRASLQLLPPPPPDGLTPERLRAAILDRELAARRPSGFSWSWAPVAATAFAVALVAFGPGLFRSLSPEAKAPMVAMNEADLFRAESKPFFEGDFSGKAGFAKVVPPPMERHAKTMAVSAPKEDRLRETGARAQRQDEPMLFALDSKSRPEGEEQPPMTMAAVYHEPQTISAPSSAIFAGPGTRTTMNNDDTVVIVSAKRDLETGAAAATEMEASHVLVGG